MAATGLGSSETESDPRSAASESEAPSPPQAVGDHVLAQSIAFMRDAINLCKFVYATAEGNVGRVYEVLKVSLSHATARIRN